MSTRASLIVKVRLECRRLFLDTVYMLVSSRTAFMIKEEKVKADIALPGEPHLRATGRHLP